MIFSTVLGPHEPALTVGSFAISATGRPPIVAMPVTTPSAPKPSCSQLASSASSTNESESTRRATRSRTGSFPWSRDFSWWRSGPPPRARSSASFRSDMGSNVSASGSEPRAQRAPDELQPAASDPESDHGTEEAQRHGRKEGRPEREQADPEPGLQADQRCGDVARLHAGSVRPQDRKSTRLNSSHTVISYAVFCLKKKKR